MENEDNIDKLTQGRSSRQIQQTTFQKIYHQLCSCFLPYSLKANKQDQDLAKENPYQQGQLQRGHQMRDSKNSKSMMSQKSSVLHDSWANRKQSLFKSVYEHANRLLQQYDESLDKSTIKKWHSYPIYQYKQNQILPMGTTKGRVLCKINCIRVQPSAIAKKKTNQSRSYERSLDKYTFTNFDKYWNKRYLLFQKFDQGISLDDQSWCSVTPEAVAEHIASKIKCDTVLDGFCGVGGDSIKLANTCSHVICNDISMMKLKCLETNTKVYSVDNIQMLNEDFLQLQGIQPDIVYICPPFGPQQNLSLNSIQPSHLKPSLQKIFQKAIQMSLNIVMLLPPNINVSKLGQLIAQSYIKLKIPSPTCSIKIQKIFFMSQLRYLAVYIGSMIENQINLNDQLGFIYNYLKEGEKKLFLHKKVIKFLRQKYGMISLLNFMYQLDKVQTPGTLIQKLYVLIKQKNLIQQNKLKKLIKEQNLQYEAYLKRKIPLISENESMSMSYNQTFNIQFASSLQQKQIVQQQKYVGEQTDKDVTLSYYSQVSCRNKRDSKIQNQQSQKEPDSPYRKSINDKNIGRVSNISILPRSNTIQCFARSDTISSKASSVNQDSNAQKTQQQQQKSQNQSQMQKQNQSQKQNQNKINGEQKANQGRLEIVQQIKNET